MTPSDGETLRGRKILVSAYACHPLQGSEPGVGYQLLKGWLALGAEVVVLTREKNIEPLMNALSREVLSGQLSVIGHDLGASVRSVKKRIPGGVQGYYSLWQISAAKLLDRLHKEHRFDLAHHATFAVDWLPVAVTRLARHGVPTVWGPVGGATRCPQSLRGFLSPGERLFEVLRDVTGWIGRAAFGRSIARTAALTVAQNQDVASSFSGVARDMLEEPNVFVDDSLVQPRGAVDGHSLIGVGRLLGWKGWTLAIRALALMPQEYHLTIYGEGPSRARLERCARVNKVQDRVLLPGYATRETVMGAIAGAHCLVHPSFHDSAPGVLGEALVSGCPTVALGVGGPALIVRAAGGRVLNPEDPDLIQKLAAAMEAPDPPTAGERWTASRVPGLLLEWYTRSTVRHGAP